MPKIILLLSVFLSFALTAYTNVSQGSDKTSHQETKIEAKKALGKNGIIATAHPLASKAGLSMLENGGNAVDAAIAASFVISVVRPQSSGIGGGGFAMIYLNELKKIDAWDFRERAPIKATRDMFLASDGKPKKFIYHSNSIPNASMNGHLAVGTPGLVAGLLKIHKKYGKLSLKTILNPAIEIAEKGFPVYPQLAAAIMERRDILAHFAGSRKLLAPNGQWLKEGDTLIQKDLGWSLRQIQKQGLDAFYKGIIAQKIVAEMTRGMGLVSLEDLKEYEVKERKAIEGTYRNFKIYAMPPPSSGGVHIIQMLNMLEGDHIKSLKPGSTTFIHLLAEVMKRAFADRAEYLGDPDFVKIPAFSNNQGLVSKIYAVDLRKTIDLKKASSSKDVKPGVPPDWVQKEPPSTTHISVADKWGNVVSTTQTVNFTFGSCVVAEETGIVLNDEMDDFSISSGTPNAFGLLGNKANEIAGKKTMLSSMSPTLVFSPDGQFSFALGSPGGPRIINAVLQVIINVIDFSMPLNDAVTAPRIHHQWFPDEIRLETITPSESVLNELKDMGHQLTKKETGVGDVQAIMRSADGEWIGVSDHRSDGVPFGY